MDHDTKQKECGFGRKEKTWERSIT